MKVIIDIPEDIYKDIMTHNREMRESGKSAYFFEGLIQNGTPLIVEDKPEEDNWSQYDCYDDEEAEI